MTQTNAWRPKVGVLALTLELYETLAPGAREDREQWMRAKVLPALGPEVECLFEGAAFRRDDVERIVAGYEAAGVDCLLVLLLTYAPSQMPLPALKRTRLPILVWNTQELHAVTESYSGADLIANHGVHGTQDLGNVLLRAGVPFEYVTSHLDDSEPAGAVLDFCRAAAAVNRLARSKLGLLGYPFPDMGDFALDTTRLSATLGCEWVHLSVEDYIQRAAAAEPDAVERLVAEYQAAYDVDADVEDADLEATARVELGVRGLVADHGLSALTYQFLAFGDDERTPTVPFVAASRLMADGVGFGGEGDLIAAAGSTLLNWLCPPASFSEIFTIDFGGNAVLMSHMGEANVAMARRDRKVRLAARPTPITRTLNRQLALVTCFEPGPATLCALTVGPGGAWRVIASAMDIVDFGPAPELVTPHSKLSPAGDVREFLTAYAKAGGPHHNAVCFGDARARLRLAAGFMGADYCEV